MNTLMGRCQDAILCLVATICLSGPAISQDTDEKSPHVPVADKFETVATEEIAPERLEDVLGMLAGKMKANTGSFKTMSARYTFYEEVYFPLGWLEPGERPNPANQGSGHWQIYGGEVGFQFADGGRKQNIHYKPTRPWKQRNEASGEERSSGRVGESYRWIINPDEFLSFDEKSKLGRLGQFPRDQQPEGRIAKRERAQSWKRNGRVISFASLFGDRGRGDNYWAVLARDVDGLKAGDDNAKTIRKVISVSKETDAAGNIRYTQTQSFTQDTLSKWSSDRVPTYITTVYDSRVAFHPVRYTYRWGMKQNGAVQEFKTERRLSYVRRGKTVVPSRVVQVEHETKPPAKSRRAKMRILSLIDLTLDSDLPPTTFTVAGLGLAPGDRLHDTVRKELSVINADGHAVKVGPGTKR